MRRVIREYTERWGLRALAIAALLAVLFFLASLAVIYWGDEYASPVWDEPSVRADWQSVTFAAVAVIPVSRDGMVRPSMPAEGHMGLEIDLLNTYPVCGRRQAYAPALGSPKVIESPPTRATASADSVGIDGRHSLNRASPIVSQ